MSNKVVFQDGLKTYDIVNEKGTLLGQFTFNPADTNIAQRHAEVVKHLSELQEKFRKSEKKDTYTFVEELKEIDAIVYEKMNYLLDADVAETFFSIMGPFSPLSSGQFFVEMVVDAIGKVISQETGARVKKVNSKIQKHTSKYHK